MKEIIVTSLILLIALSGMAQRRYYHETGQTILRVDEDYPGALVEHRYVPTGSDNLFRAFLAFGDDAGNIAYGSAHEFAPLAEGTFDIIESIDSLDIIEYYDTLYDTTITTIDSVTADTTIDTTYALTQSITNMAFEDTAFGIKIYQNITADFDTGCVIWAIYAIQNNGTEALSGLNAVLMYDGDVPDYSYSDDYPEGYDYLSAVGVRDGSSDVCAGFCSLNPHEGMTIGAWRDWFGTATTTDNITTLVNTPPGWPADSEIVADDWSVFGLWGLGDLAVGVTETLEIAFIVSDTSGYDSIAAEIRGDSLHPIVAESELPEVTAIRLYPNPFNAVCRIDISMIDADISSIEIFDISGRKVRDLEENISRRMVTEVVWDGRDASGFELPSGVYFIRLKGSMGFQSFARVVLLR